MKKTMMRMAGYQGQRREGMRMMCPQVGVG
jgi:hypothetical protein